MEYSMNHIHIKSLARSQNALLNFPPAFIQTTAASYINHILFCPVNSEKFWETEEFCTKRTKLSGGIYLG